MSGEVSDVCIPMAVPEDGKLQSLVTSTTSIFERRKLRSRSHTPSSRDSKQGSLRLMRARVNPEDEAPVDSKASASGSTPASLQSGDRSSSSEMLVMHARAELGNKRSSLSSDSSHERSVTPPSLMAAELHNSKSRQKSESIGEDVAEPNNTSRLVAVGSSDSSPTLNGVPSKQNSQPERSALIPSQPSRKVTPPSAEESKVSRLGSFHPHEGDEKSEAIEESFLPPKIISLYSSSAPEIPRYQVKSKGSVCAVGPVNGGDRHWLPIPPRPRIFESSQLERHSVAMRDGVLLAVDVYLPIRKSNSIPSKSTTFPTALHFTRFNRDWSFKKKKAFCWASLFCCCCCGCFSHRLGMSGYPGVGNSHWNIRTGRQVEQFCAAGFAWVTVDLRGSGASQGFRSSDLNAAEIQDLAEIAQWVETQPWSNGKIVSLGSNYDALMASYLALSKRPSIVAVAPMFMPFDIYDELFYPGGIRCRTFAASYQKFARSLERNVPSQAEFPLTMRTLLATVLSGVSPSRGGQSALDAAVLDHHANFDFLDTMQSYANRDDPFLTLPNIDTISLHAAVVSAGHVPSALLLVCGWMDAGNALGAIRYYTYAEQMSARQHQAGPRPRLVIGPWSQAARLNCSPFARSSKPLFPLNAELLRFFDGKVDLEEVGEGKAMMMLGAKNEVPVHYFTIGEERWKASTVWPPPHENLRLELTQNKTGLKLKLPKGTQGRSIREELANETHVLTLGTHEATQWPCDSRATSGTTSRWSFTQLSTDQSNLYPNRAFQDQYNLLYDSPPLPTALEVTGHPAVTLYLATDVKDATVFVYLEEKRDDGRVVYVTEGQLRLGHREIGAKESPYLGSTPYRSYSSSEYKSFEPNVPERVIIPFLPCSFQFAKGSRIRLSIASSDADNFDPLPEPPPSVFTIFHRHSYLNLPEVKPMT